jgi:hypothetical protein
MSGQTHFCTPKPYEEVLNAAKAMENAGRLTPKHEQTFRNRLKKLESKKGVLGLITRKMGIHTNDGTGNRFCDCVSRSEG